MVPEMLKNDYQGICALRYRVGEIDHTDEVCPPIIDPKSKLVLNQNLDDNGNKIKMKRKEKFGKIFSSFFPPEVIWLWEQNKVVAL